MWVHFFNNTLRNRNDDPPKWRDRKQVQDQCVWCNKPRRAHWRLLRLGTPRHFSTNPKTQWCFDQRHFDPGRFGQKKLQCVYGEKKNKKKHTHKKKVEKLNLCSKNHRFWHRIAILLIFYDILDDRGYTSVVLVAKKLPPTGWLPVGGWKRYVITWDASVDSSPGKSRKNLHPMDTQNDGLEKVVPFKYGHVWYLC